MMKKKKKNSVFSVSLRYFISAVLFVFTDFISAPSGDKPRRADGRSIRQAIGLRHVYA